MRPTFECLVKTIACRLEVIMPEIRSLRVAVMFLVCLLALSHSLFAQDRAAINGVVTDSSGAVVPNATIDVTSPATGFQRSVVSGPNGLYEVTPLPVGSYTITFKKEGFTLRTVENVYLEYGETRTFDVKLEVGGV